MSLINILARDNLRLYFEYLFKIIQYNLSRLSNISSDNNDKFDIIKTYLQNIEIFRDKELKLGF